MRKLTLIGLVLLLIPNAIFAREVLVSEITIEYPSNAPKFMYLVYGRNKVQKYEVAPNAIKTIQLKHEAPVQGKDVFGFNYNYGSLYFSNVEKDILALLSEKASAILVLEPVISIDKDYKVSGIINNEYQTYLQQTESLAFTDSIDMNLVLPQMYVLEKAKLDALVKIKDDQLAGDLLIYLVPRAFTKEEQNQIEGRYGEKFKNSEKLKYVFSQFERRRFVSRTVHSIDLKDVLLKDYKYEVKNHDYTLIDFWATWCSPCIGEFPEIKQITDKYTTKGLNVLYISLDKEFEKWKAYLPTSYIKDERNFFLEGEFKNPFITMLNINAIPSNIIVNRDGEIVFFNLHGKELEGKLAELMKK